MLAGLAVCAPQPAAALAGEAPPAATAAQEVIRQVVFTGGSPDDVAFAQAAAALGNGSPAAEGSFQVALAAIRMTDRFRGVEGRLVRGVNGVTADIRLDPWPPLAHVTVEGLPRGQVTGLRLKLPLGAHRLEAWRAQFQARLQEAGYPLAQVRCERLFEGRGLAVTVVRGKPALVTQVEVAGQILPYTRKAILKHAGLVPGKTLWTAGSQLEILNRLRKRLTRDNRLEGQVEVAWADGLVRLTVEAGPEVLIRSDGDSLGWTVSLKDMVGLARANRYSPELLDEADRRILRALRTQGYLDAQVTHLREVVASGLAGPRKVQVTFTVKRGETSPIGAVRFEGNQALTEAELRKAADLPFSFLSAQGPEATPELMDGVESRVKDLYLSRGYTEASVRLQPLRREGDRYALVYRVYEGPRRLVSWLKLDLPPGGLGDPWGLGECLTRLLSDKPLRVAVGLNRRYATDQPALAGVEATLDLAEDPARGGALVLTLALSRPVPLLKSDLAKIFNALRQQRLPALGVVRPVVRLALEDTPAGTGVHLVVPTQAEEKVARLIVAGSTKTRARAVLRETQIAPGAPLDLNNLSRVQARLSFMGAFQRVDLTSMADLAADTLTPDPHDAAPEPWKQGDLLLGVEERPPWVLTNSFGYDSTQGYHFGTGVQWLNVGGMGRTVDLGIRAGDGTIGNPTLKKWFPTPSYNRSVDSFSLGYTDPWFEPPALEGWLHDRTQMAMEAAYIEERRSLYLLHRRRFTTSLQWLLSPKVSLQMGYRFERVDTAAALPTIDSATLAILAHYPLRDTISAPYVQLARDTRDNALDPTSGSYSVARMELANQLFFTSPNASFVKVDLRQQWTWPVGRKASAGVVALGLRVGMARPTAASAQDLPLSERFFAGGSFTQRGVQPDSLGPLTTIPLRSSTYPFGFIYDANGNPESQTAPLGGQGLALINLEYRFPLFSKSVYGEVFVDSGQVYASLFRQANPEAETGQTIGAQFPPFRTSLGFGLIFKWSIPIKLEYAADLKRIMGDPRSPSEVATQLKGISISAGFQF